MTVPIPRQFHAIWVGPRPLPEYFEEIKASWLRHHPDWSFRLWRDDDLTWLHNRWLYDRATSPAQKADIARYEILYRHGGVYVDTDMECLKPLAPLIEGLNFFAGWEDPETINIGIIGSTPGHQLLRSVIARIPAACLLRRGRGIHRQTGPSLFTEVIRSGSWEQRAGVKIFDRAFFYPYLWDDLHPEEADLSRAYAHHRWSGTWTRESPLRLSGVDLPRVFSDTRSLSDPASEVIARGTEVLTSRVVRPLKAVAKQMIRRAIAQFPQQPRAVRWGDDLVLVRLLSGQRLFVSVADHSLAPDLALDGTYDPAFIEFMKETLRPGMTFVDVGANVGLFSVIAADLVGPSGRIISIECNPTVLPILKKNIQVNWQIGRTRIVEKAATERAGVAEFTVPVGQWGLGSLAKTQPHPTEVAGSETYQVNTAPLTAILGQERYIDLIKVDVEGGERGVLLGAWQLFSEERVGQLSIEFRLDALRPTLVKDMQASLEALEREFSCDFYDPQSRRMLTLDEVLTIAHFPQLVVTFPWHGRQRGQGSPWFSEPVS